MTNTKQPNKPTHTETKECYATTKEQALEQLRKDYLIISGSDKQLLIDDLIQQGLVSPKSTNTNTETTNELPPAINRMKQWTNLRPEQVNQILDAAANQLQEFTIQEITNHLKNYQGLTPTIIQNSLQHGIENVYLPSGNTKYKYVQ